MRRVNQARSDCFHDANAAVINRSRAVSMMSFIALPDGEGAAIVEFGPDPVDIEGLVRQEGLEVDVHDEGLDTDTILALAGQQDEARKIAERVNQGHDLGRQTAARAPDSLILSPPLCRCHVGAPARSCHR